MFKKDYHFQPSYGHQIQQTKRIDYGDEGQFIPLVSTVDDYDDEKKRPINSYYTNRRFDRNPDPKDGLLLSSSSITKISETLGALNTVGRYIVNITRGHDTTKDSDDTSDEKTSSTSEESIPDAILTLTKNVLGQNVEKTIEPLLKRTHTLNSESTGKSPKLISDNKFIKKQNLKDIVKSNKREIKNTTELIVSSTINTPTTVKTTTAISPTNIIPLAPAGMNELN